MVFIFNKVGGNGALTSLVAGNTNGARVGQMTITTVVVFFYTRVKRNAGKRGGELLKNNRISRHRTGTVVVAGAEQKRNDADDGRMRTA